MSSKFVLVALIVACGSSRNGLLAPEYGVTACDGSGYKFAKDLEPLNCGPGCTGNSPVVNTFPINGVAKHGDGECNPEGVQILPHSLHGGGCGWGRSLGIDKSGRLVGMRDDGTTACDSQRLAGAEFIARSGPSITLRMTITNVRPLIVKSPQKPAEGYRIESGGQSLCDPAAANRARQELGFAPQPTYYLPNAPSENDLNSDLVIPIEGPIYSTDVRTIDHGEKLFNLACASDALAKRSINNVAVGDKDTEGQKLAALRMLTASYCGKQRTIRGMTIDWTTHSDGTLEANWLGRDTTCLDSPRLTYLPEVLLKGLPPELTPAKCENGCLTWRDWSTAVRRECQYELPFCTPPTPNRPMVNAGMSTAKAKAKPNYDFESFVHNDNSMGYETKKKD